MIYVDQAGAGNFNRGWWQQDWPEAEDHFTHNLKRLTRIAAGAPVTLRLTDEQLFDYPWLYATQTGFWDLDDVEVARLREYLLRGGFLMADDFWGESELAVFTATMERVFPDRQMVALHGDDAVLHVVFSIDESVQIPGSAASAWLWPGGRAAATGVVRHLRRCRPADGRHQLQPGCR